MDKINLHNYEAYFLDYVEGNLDAQQQNQLEVFLTKHPDLKAELQDFDNIQLTESKSQESFQHKKFLKRDEKTSLSHVDTLLIASIEGLLSDGEAQELTRLLSDPKISKQLSAYQKVKLKADPNISYPYKHSLKRKQAFSFKNSFKYAAAAAIIFSVFYFNQSSESRYEWRSLQLPQEKKDDFKLDLPVYSSNKSNNAKVIEQSEKHLIHDKSSIIAETKQIPLQGPQKLKSPKLEQAEPILQKSMAALPVKSNKDIEEVDNKLDEELAFESLEYSMLPSLLFDALNKKLLNEQLNFNQERSSNGKSKGFALNFGGLEISHSKGN